MIINYIYNDFKTIIYNFLSFLTRLIIKTLAKKSIFWLWIHLFGH